MPAFNPQSARDVARLRTQWIAAISPPLGSLLAMLRRSECELGRPGTPFLEFFKLMAHYFLYMLEYLPRMGWVPSAHLGHRIAVAVVGAARIALEAEQNWPPALQSATGYAFEDIASAIRWALVRLTPESRRWWIARVKQAIPPQFSDSPRAHRRMRIEKDPLTRAVRIVSYETPRRPRKDGPTLELPLPDL